MGSRLTSTPRAEDRRCSSRAGMVERTPRNLVPLLRAYQGVVVGTVISLALFVAAVRFTRFGPLTDDQGDRLVIGFFAITATGATSGALAGAAVGSRSTKKKHLPATEGAQHPLFDKEVR